MPNPPFHLALQILLQAMDMNGDHLYYFPYYLFQKTFQLVLSIPLQIFSKI